MGNHRGSLRIGIAGAIFAAVVATVFQAVTIKANPKLTSAKTLRINLSSLHAPAGARLVRTQGIGTLLPH